jgi:hypothetical protein
MNLTLIVSNSYKLQQEGVQVKEYFLTGITPEQMLGMRAAYSMHFSGETFTFFHYRTASEFSPVDLSKFPGLNLSSTEMKLQRFAKLTGEDHVRLTESSDDEEHSDDEEYNEDEPYRPPMKGRSKRYTISLFEGDEMLQFDSLDFMYGYHTLLLLAGSNPELFYEEISDHLENKIVSWNSEPENLGGLPPGLAPDN